MASTTTSWYPLPRRENARRSWLLDDGTIMGEPALEQSASARRVRAAEVPNVADYMKNVDNFVSEAARAVASRRGRRLWMALGKPNYNVIDGPATCELASLDVSVKPHFLDDARGYRQTTAAAWRFRHPSLPIEAQIECVIQKVGYGRSGDWTVQTQLFFPGTCCLDSATPTVFTIDEGKRWDWDALTNKGIDELERRLKEWSEANPIEWCDGFEFGIQKFPHERQAIDAFAKIIREINGLDEIEIPNLVNIYGNVLDASKIQMMSLRIYKTNATQDLLDILTDFLNGEPVVEQIKVKWREMTALFRSLGMVVEDPRDTDWWNFMTLGADQAPIEVEIKPVIDEETPASAATSSRHAVMINLATGTVVVTCSKQTSRNETAIQWETSLIKAEMTGQKDRFLAYADKYVEERQTAAAQQLMTAELDAAKIKKTK